MNRFDMALWCYVLVPAVTSFVLVQIWGTYGIDKLVFFGDCLIAYTAVLVFTVPVKQSLTSKPMSGRKKRWLVLLIPIQALLYAFIMITVPMPRSALFWDTVLAWVIYLVVFYSIIYGGAWVVALALNKGKLKKQ